MRFVSKRSAFAYSPDDESDEIVTRSVIAFIDSEGLWWIAPKNMTCDGQSVPAFLWPFVGHPLEVESIRAAVLHDAYYKNPCGRTRAQIDRMFNEALLADGVGPVEAQAKYRAVRWFGWIAWRNHRRREKQ